MKSEQSVRHILSFYAWDRVMNRVSYRIRIRVRERVSDRVLVRVRRGDGNSVSQQLKSQYEKA